MQTDTWVGEEIFIAFIVGFPPGRTEAARSFRSGMIPLPSHCVSIAPNADVVQKERKPLATAGIRFPFGGMYVWTTVGVRAHVNDVWPVPPNAQMALDEPDLARFKKYFAEDLQAQAKADRERTTPKEVYKHTRPGLGGISQLNELVSLDVWLDVSVALPDVDPFMFYLHENDINGVLPKFTRADSPQDDGDPFE
ncbi:hypothetical protein EXIGLDRAFT_757577 [Exidia glandulosa HHB12029]|uniref:Uncharacterized protein n=1 Tax=Exidia glandulosa HHB12029 TaxID=1314781 RepID=A0A166N0B0_EXIGL|nr:hypothetical protein EXIGLDRAFT_757577 [Exidia glandulosa HHB12029]